MNRSVAARGETVDQDVEHCVRGVLRCVTHGVGRVGVALEREAPSLVEVLTA